MNAQRTRVLATLLSLVLVAAVTVPGAVAGATETNDTGDLTLSVSQDKATGNVSVELTEDNTSVNGTVTVAGDAYAGNGTYTLGSDGAITLPEPHTTVDVTIEAEYNNSSVSSNATLVPRADSLAVDVSQTDSAVVVSVTQYGDTVENATVNVSTTDANASYVGAGEYTTDESGTVTLDSPNKSVEIAVEATYEDLKANTTAQLTGAGLDVSVSQAEDYSVIIDVTYDGEPADGAAVTVDGEYAYTGDHTTDENGTVELPAPANDTTINVTAAYENETATTPATIQARNDSNPNNDFAQALVDFIRFLHMNGTDGPPGLLISDFVHEHNPASADDDAGPPEHAGPSKDAGPPSHAGPQNESVNATEENETDGQGPPPWAGPPGNETDDEDDDKRGPPDNAGPPDK